MSHDTNRGRPWNHIQLHRDNIPANTTSVVIEMTFMEMKPQWKPQFALSDYADPDGVTGWMAEVEGHFDTSCLQTVMCLSPGCRSAGVRGRHHFPRRVLWWLDHQWKGSFVFFSSSTSADSLLNVPHGNLNTDMVLLISSSQGVLSLPNGDFLEGTFSGEWIMGLKVVGTYRKPAPDEPDDKDRNRHL